MGITMVELYVLNFFNGLVEVAPVVILVFFTMKEKLSWRKQISLILLMSLSDWLINSLVTDIALPEMSLQTIILSDCFYLIAQVSIYYLFFRKSAWIFLGLVSYFKVFFHMLIGLIAIMRFSFLADLGTLSAEVVLTVIQLAVLIAVILLLIYRYPSLLTKLYEVFQLKTMIFFAVFAVNLYSLFPVIMSPLLQNSLSLDRLSSRIIVSVYLITLGLFLYTLVNLFANGLVQKRILVGQTTTILQQETYVSKLEQIQKDMHVLQQNYQSVLSSASGQSEKSFQKVQAYLNETLMDFDDNLVESIRQINQITAIELMDLRGVILKKIGEMEQKQIAVNIEVFSPISTCQIKVEDLVSYLDTVIDEAISVSSKSLQPKIDLILLQEKTNLTIVVKYQVGKTYQHQVIAADCQERIKKYTNVFSKTVREGESLIQTLKII